MVKALREHIRRRNPKVSLGIEWFSDVTSQHVDYIHNITGGAGPGGFQEGSTRGRYRAQILGPVHHHDATIIEESPGEVVRQKRHPGLPFPGGEDLRSRIGEPLQGLLQQAALAPRGSHQHHQVGH